VIIEVNRAAVKDVDAYQAALKTSTKGKSVLLLIRRGDATVYVPVKPEA
jgi:S1-C subfamily serine protease